MQITWQQFLKQLQHKITNNTMAITDRTMINVGSEMKMLVFRIFCEFAAAIIPYLIRPKTLHLFGIFANFQLNFNLFAKLKLINLKINFINF